jgi:signal transduction histidine kinase
MRRRKDGTIIDVSISISPIRKEDHQIIGAAKIIRDITDRKRSEELIRKTEKLAIASRLAASVAHEINNPLAGLTNLFYLMKREELSKQAAIYLDMAERELARVSHITTQALGFYKENTSPGEHVLSSILEQALALHAHRIESDGIIVNKRYAEVPPIICHAGEIRQVFVNLIGNAIDAMAGSGRLCLRVQMASNSRTNLSGVRISVADSGCGMSPDAFSHLFEPFYTTKGQIRAGLGLWMCEQIVKRHNGTITVRSSQAARNHGTVISVFLPCSHIVLTRPEGSGETR